MIQEDKDYYNAIWVRDYDSIYTKAIQYYYEDADKKGQVGGKYFKVNIAMENLLKLLFLLLFERSMRFSNE